MPFLAAGPMHVSEGADFMAGKETADTDLDVFIKQDVQCDGFARTQQ